MSPRLLAWAGLGLALAAGWGLAGLQTLRLAELRQEVAQERAAKLDAALALAQNHRATEAKLAANTRRAADALTAQLRAADAAAAGLADDHRRLLDALGADGDRPAEDSAAACRGHAERVRLLERLLAEGAGLAAEGAARAVRLDARLSGLQQYAAGLQPLTQDGKP